MSSRTQRLSAFLVCVILLCVIPGIWSTLIAGSKLTTCVQNGNQDALSAQLQCSQKFIVAIALNNGQNNTESIQATFTSATDDNGRTVRLDRAVAISLAKSQILWNYPLDYRMEVNAKPTEEIVYVPSTLFVPRCVDSDASQAPTCGWFLDSAGANVRDSQGYCCDCSLAQLVGADQSSTRAGLNCNFFTGESSGHCMRLDPLWYSVFGIGPVETSFEVRVTITQQGPDGTPIVQTLTLSPSVQGAVSNDRKVLARLVGDFASWTAPHTLSNKYLVVPHTPTANARVQNPIAYSLLVGQDQVTLDGSERNKIGVGFSAFRFEPNPCANVPGSSLRNQVEDLYQADIQRVSRGQKGNYLVSGFGDPLLYEDTQGRRVLAFRTVHTQASMLTLELAADNIQFVTNLSPGKIVSAQVPSFESLSLGGTLTVVIRNTGTINADYSVTVTDCTSAIQPIQALPASLAAGASTSLLFSVRANTYAGGDQNCTVRLFDSQNDLSDSLLIFFNTTNTQLNNNQAGQAPNDENRFNSGTGVSGLTCNEYCPLIVDIPCFIVKGCWTSILILVGIAVGIIVFIVVIRKVACLRKLCKCCLCWPCMLCSRCCSSKKKKTKAKEKTQKHKRSSGKESHVGQKDKGDFHQVDDGSSSISSEESHASRDNESSDSGHEMQAMMKSDRDEVSVKIPKHRPLTAYDLYDLVQAQSLVYFNTVNDRNQFRDLLTVRKGAKFCIMGVLRYAEHSDRHSPRHFRTGSNHSSDPEAAYSPAASDTDSSARSPTYVFELDPLTTHQRLYYSRTRNKYVAMEQPRRLRRSDFMTELSEADALRVVSVRAKPGYVCLNRPKGR
uniref:HAP2-like protein n=1 Tax=Malawimonas californiana TaxID=221722 RepID=A0A0K0VK49_MALCL|nr:HAP2-like protein [Malawimonas californiana]